MEHVYIKLKYNDSNSTKSPILFELSLFMLRTKEKRGVFFHLL